MLGSRLRHFIGKGTHPPAMSLEQLHDPPLVPALASVRSSLSAPRPCRSLVMARADREFPFKLSDAEWRQRLNAEEFRVLRQGGTEAPGKGQYCKLFPKTGYFACRACKHPLYPATSKFPDSGWDAYSTCAAPPPPPPSPPSTARISRSAHLTVKPCPQASGPAKNVTCLAVPRALPSRQCAATAAPTLATCSLASATPSQTSGTESTRSAW